MIPIILFAYSRPNHLRQTLDCLRQDSVPFIYAFSDGPRTADKAVRVSEVRRMLRSMDWCEVEIRERKSNMGLGLSILTGVTEVLSKHEMAIIYEDDLVSVPGTYNYLCAAMKHFSNHPQVMSVTAWNHPSVTPPDVGDQPYFDGRAECLVWGTWAKVWLGMKNNAETLMNISEQRGIDPFSYGEDLVSMARVEQKQNIWAVRFLYWHIVNHGLCMRPPWSMVEHIGFDSEATNSADGAMWSNPPLRPCPPVPDNWPIVIEHEDCRKLWQKVCGARPTLIKRFFRFSRGLLGGVKRNLLKKESVTKCL